MVNISANGFAFSVRDNVFASQKGRNVQLDVKDFAVIGNKPLTGCVIRSSNNEGNSSLDAECRRTASQLKNM